MDDARRTRRGAGALWTAGAVGFACGAAFWHLLGFWTLVADVVWNPRTATPTGGGAAAFSAPARAPARTGALPTGTLPTCTVADIGRPMGATRLAPCPAGAPRLRAHVGGRRDLADFGATPVPVIIGRAATAETAGWAPRTEAARVEVEAGR
jgi:hypothetical protein